MARLVAAAHASGLSEREIRRHCRAALNEATSNGAAYLQGALDPENLPVPSALPQRSGGQADPAADDERAEEQAESPMLRTQAQDEIRRILSGARAQSR